MDPVSASRAGLDALSGNACFIHLPAGSFKKELGFFKRSALWCPQHLSEHEFVASRKVACDAILQDDIANGFVADFFPYRRKERFAREESFKRVYNG